MDKHPTPPTEAGDRIENPGKGKRTPQLWGQWLTGGLRGLQRQMLDMLNMRHDGAEQHPGARGTGSMYQGTASPKAVARRRARNKVARRSRRLNRIAAKR